MWFKSKKRLAFVAVLVAIPIVAYNLRADLFTTTLYTRIQKTISKEGFALNPDIEFQFVNVTHNNKSLHVDNSETQSGLKSNVIQSTDEVHHIAYLKVHKTGSSTVQNLFLRFIDSRNLTMVFPHTSQHPLSEAPCCSNVISINRTLHEGNIVPPPYGRHYDILCCHVVFNEGSFKTYMPHDTVYIGIVREPFKRFESAMRFFGLFRNYNASSFANDPFRFDKDFPSHANNRMAFEFGFPLKLFPKKNATKPDRFKVLSYLDTIHRQFDLILINERMNESLVYMRRLLGWKLEDIIYLSKQVAKRISRRFTKDDKEKLADYLLLDLALYNYSIKEFDSKFKSLGQDAIDEVTLFSDILQKVADFCANATLNNIVIPQSKWSLEIVITHKKCDAFSRREAPYVKSLRKKTYGSTTN